MTLPPLERPKVLPFRPRGGQQVRYRRQSPLRELLGPFALALVIVALPLTLGWWLVRTPRLALAEVAVDADPAAGAPARVEPAWIEHELEPFLGENLLRLDLETVRARVSRHPWVRSATARKELPHRLRLTFAERRPAALYDRAGDLVYVDPEGQPIAPWQPGDVVDLPVIYGALGIVDDESSAMARPAQLRAALAVAGELAATRPAWAAELSEIEILGAQDFRLVIESLAFPLLVRAGSLDRRLRRLEALLPQITRRYAALRAVDLRFARRIIVQPAALVTGSRNRSTNDV